MIIYFTSKWMIKKKSKNSAEGKRAQVISRIQSHQNSKKTPGPLNVSRAALAHDTYTHMSISTHTIHTYEQRAPPQISLRRFSSHHLTMESHKLNLSSSCVIMFWIPSYASLVFLVCVYIQFLVICLVRIENACYVHREENLYLDD